MKVRRVTIIGAGHGGHAAAAHLTMLGFEVTLFSRNAQKVEAIRARGGIEIRGAAGEGLVDIAHVTVDIAQAVRDADVLMLTVPISTLGFYARLLAPVTEAGQIVYLNPGHTCGGLFFVASLREQGYHDLVRTGESATLSYGTRLQDSGEVMIYTIAPTLPFAAFPGKHLDEVAEAVSQFYSFIDPRESVLETAFANLNAVEHPAQMICNAALVERAGGDFYFYYEGTTPAVGRLMEQVDRERMAVAKALGVPVISFAQDFYETNFTSKEAYESGSLYRVMRESEPNRWVKAPTSLDHRYLHEDVGFGLVPMSAFGDMVAVPTPVMDSLIGVASALTGRSYAVEGLTLEKMGLDVDTSREDLERFLKQGHL